MQYSGFFDALLVDEATNQYDREYSANDYCDMISTVIHTGVLRTENEDLLVSVTGLVPTVNTGKAIINGHYYYNDEDYEFPAIPVPVAGSRKDRIILRLDLTVNERKIELHYVQGTTGANPTFPNLVRNSMIYEICLANITINAGATSVTLSDTRSDNELCGWVYSTVGDPANSFLTNLDNQFNAFMEANETTFSTFMSTNGSTFNTFMTESGDTFDQFIDDNRETLANATLFKRYEWSTDIQVLTSSVTFNIPQYDPDVCILDVLVNGMHDKENSDYTLEGSTIHFLGSGLVVGTEVIVYCYKSIDSAGATSVIDDVTTLQNDVAILKADTDYTYLCSGVNDNLSISQICKTIYNGVVETNLTNEAEEYLKRIFGNDYSGISNLSESQITIHVVGNLGATSPVSGSGASTSRYKWFELGIDTATERKVILDFTDCKNIRLTGVAGSYYIGFYGTDMYIRNLNVNVLITASNTEFEMFAGRYNNVGNISVSDSKIKLATTGKATIAEKGTFINCDVYCSSQSSHALLFCPDTNSLIRVIGGRYRAYCGINTNVSAIAYTYATATNAVTILDKVNAPTISVSGYFQNKFAVCYAGNTIIDGVITTLTRDGTYKNETNVIAKNKTA